MIGKQNILEELENYLKQQESKELVRFITCGSVDDGKSTLIGRLLYDSKIVFEDHLAALEIENKKWGHAGEEIDFALLVDGLQSEREQGITIDVAYRYFATEKRKYIIADTPGHEQYTRNMATGASTANLAILLIDARNGLTTQTKRHSFIVNLLGIKHIAVTINKMDLVDYSEQVFEEIKEQYTQFAKALNFSDITYIPLSALKGENIVNESSNMPWYKGQTLINYLDNIEIFSDLNLKDFRLPIQYVNRPNLNFRGFAGTIVGGKVKKGDEIIVLPSGQKSKIKEILIPATEKTEPSDVAYLIEQASVPMAVTITTEDEIDISRGDIIALPDNTPEIAKVLDVMLIWMNENNLDLNNEYIIKRSTTSIKGKFSQIYFQQDINNMQELKTDKLKLNEIAKCKLELTQEIAFDSYKKLKEMGSFIVIDKHSNNTLGAGITLNQTNEQNSKQQTTLKQQNREYTKTEIELNKYIRTNFPEWNCKEIF